MKSTGLWRWTGQSSKPYFLPYWGKEKQVTSPRKIVRLSASFHSSTPLGVVSWEHNIPAHSESCLQLYRFFGTWEKLSELYKSNAKCSWEWNLSAKIPGWPHCVDHFERNKCRRQTHSLPAPCKQPETMNPKLVASGPHREIYPLCPSSSAPLASMSTEERCLMIPILKVEFVLNYGSLLPSHFRPHRASMFTFFLKGPAIPSSEFSFQTFWRAEEKAQSLYTD